MLNDPRSIEVTVQRRVEVDVEAFTQLALELLDWATQGNKPLLRVQRRQDVHLNGIPDWSHDDLVAAFLDQR